MNCARPVIVHSKYGAECAYPCGKCISCRASKAKEWAQRLKNEQSEWTREGFLTLTYDDDHIPKLGHLEKGELSQFFKRLRFHLGDKKIKYFACGEYGSQTWRPHYHAIVFGIDSRDMDAVLKAWKKGERVSLDPVLPGGIEYVTGYVRKKIDIKYGDYKRRGLPLPFQLQSQGLGLAWAEKNKHLLESNGLTREGKNISIPRYYMRKLNLNGEAMYTVLDKDITERNQILIDSGVDIQQIRYVLLKRQAQGAVNHLAKLALYGHE
nr:MAG: replication initiator protein [Microvirus sp.]